MIKILPSLASANQLCLKDEIEKVKFIRRLHFDIEDGNFVPNITFGMKTVNCVCKILEDVERDAHLMVTNPLDYVKKLGEAGFSAIAFHWEAAPYPMRLIEEIHKFGMRAGIALNPRTPAEDILLYLGQIDYILLMSSEPDGVGELFQEHVLNKVRVIKDKRWDMEVIVDGGVNAHNFQKTVLSGADGVVLGRAIFQAKNVREFIEKLHRIV